MNNFDTVFSWFIVLIVIIGFFKVGLRVQRWYRTRARYDLLEPDTVETRYSLRDEK